MAAHLAVYIDRAGSDAKDQILSCFDGMQEWSRRPDFNGCYFVSALTEYSDTNNEIGDIARQYKLRFLDRLRSLCRNLDLPEPEIVAKSIFMLIEGATVTHMSLGDKESYARARAIAAHVLAS